MDTNGHTNGEQPKTNGVLGDGSLQAGKGNMALARRAFREGWPITPEVRQAVVDQMAKIVEGSESERNQVAASRVLVSADSVNVRRRLRARNRQDALPPSVNVQVVAGVSVNNVDLSKLTDEQLSQLSGLLDKAAPHVDQGNGRA